MIWNLRLDSDTKALWEGQAGVEGVSLSEFVRSVVVSACTTSAANRAVARAVKEGVLHRSRECEECGKECKTEGAHEDYRRPLDVRWLCTRCHRSWDNAHPKQETASDHTVPLRMPETLGEKLKRVAHDRGRSVNAEILARLEESFGLVAHEPPPVEAVLPPLPPRPFRPDFKKIKPKK